MVKTRHSGDLDDPEDNVFMSLPTRAARVKKVYEPQLNGYDSDGSVEDRHFVRRSTRRRALVMNDFAEESSSDSSETEDDDETEEDDETEDEEEENGEEADDNESNNNKRGRKSRKLSFGALSRAGKSSPRASSSNKSPSGRSSKETSVERGTRRSSRQRKLIYGSFNENDIKLMQAVNNDTEVQSSPERKRRKKLSEVEALQEEAREDIDGMGRSTRHRSRLQRAIFGAKGGRRSKERDTSQTEDSESEDSSSDSDGNGRRHYSLREHKPTTSRYMAPINEPRKLRKRNLDLFRETTPPARTRKVSKASYQSPARRRTGNYRKRSKKAKADDGRRKAFHDSDSTSSSGSSSGGDSSDDERRFQRRKAKSMAKARGRLLPMNFTNDDISAGVLRDRTRAGASMADIDPMDLDRNVTFESIGGLGKHLRKLKEMIVFPLLYPEVFERFHIAPPRGVLFYGPPGTGKTLVARALANECSKGERKVAFFMRKGADCLSKWVGESERQLRLLFDQAYQMRPSVIFFDEIDGLAPVRSSKQDQIHSSLVSTLLALMDGLDNRGEIVVIGATNRIDSIDPALRRPGRFDREFLFPLPTQEARTQILQIHTKEWNPKIRTSFMQELATKTVGYCGADLKSLCTEAALHALRRRYPQIYASNDKLQLDVSSIEVSAKDFSRAMDGIVPTAQRSASAPGRALRPCIKPLMERVFQKAMDTLMESFPAVQLAKMASLDVPDDTCGGVECDDYSDQDDVAPSIFEATARNGRVKKRHTEDDEDPKSFLSFISNVGQVPVTHRPRMLLAGSPGQGQSSHVAPALLHAMEKLPVHVLDLPALYAVSVKTAEESCADVFREARRTSPSIIYMPHIGEWWDVINDTVRSTFLALLRDVEPTMPLLLLATSQVSHSHLSPEIRQLFNATSGEVVTMHNPSDAQRREFFQDLLLNQVKKAPPSKKQTVDPKTGRSVRFVQKSLEVLPKAPPPEPRKLTEAEVKRLNQQEEATMRELRLFLRDILNKLGRDRKFQIFAKPVDEEEVPDYYEIIEHPMDLSTMMSKIDLHQYQTVKAFLDDVDLICQNALEYNPDKDPQNRAYYTRLGRAIRHRACSLKDTALALMTSELDPDFEKLCEDIAAARQKRGQDSRSTVPDYYFTKPLNRPWQKPLEECLPNEYRKRGRTDDAPSTSGSNGCSTSNGSVDFPKIRKVIKRVAISRKTNSKVSPWCKPTKRRWKKVTVYVDEQGNEVPDPNGPNEQSEEEQDSEGENKDESGSNESEERKVRTRSRSQGDADNPRESPRADTSLLNGRASGKNKSPGRSPNASRSPGRSPTTRARSRSKSPVSKSPRARTPSPQRNGQKETIMEEEERETDTGRRSSRSGQKSAADSPKVTVDEAHLRRFLDVMVRQTNNFNVEKLEKLHSRMSQCIYRHRADLNKARLIQEMENTLDKFCSCNW